MACQYDDTLERVKSTVDEMQSLPTNENTEHIMEKQSTYLSGNI
jgi:hypothetical protein